MNDINKLQEYIKDSSMILVINNNSKLLMNTLFDSIYKKYSLSKTQFDSRRRLISKLSRIKNKLIKLNFDLTKIQFTSSSNNKIQLRTDFLTLKTNIQENKSKLLLKTNLAFYDKNPSFHLAVEDWNSPYYRIFDLIIFIDKDNIKIVDKYRTTKATLEIDQLIRKTKLKKLNLKSH